METLINKFRELSRNTQIGIVIAVCVFTPIVSIVLSILVGGIGFVLGFVKWSVAIPMLLIFGGYKAYVLFNTEDDEEEEDIFNPFA